MSMSVGSSTTSALSYLQQLLQQGTAGAGDAKKASASDPLSMLMQAVSGDGTSSGQTSTATPATTAGAGSTSAAFSSDAMSAMISAQSDKDSKLFSKLDSDGDGTISKSEFESAATAAGADSSVADAVFNKIDGNSDGSVSKAELSKADHGGHRHHGHVGGGGGTPSAGGAQDPLEAALSDAASGATTQTSTNADGSTTTTITYADGSKIDLTSAASASSSSTSASSSSSASSTKSNLLEQLIKLQSQVIGAATSTLSAIA